MLKNIINLKGSQILSKNEQKQTAGGLLPVGQLECRSPYLVNAGESCDPGDYFSPEFGHCVCCRG